MESVAGCVHLGWGTRTWKNPDVSKRGCHVHMRDGGAQREVRAEDPRVSRLCVARTWWPPGVEQRRARAGPPGEPSHVPGGTEGPTTRPSQGVTRHQGKGAGSQVGGRRSQVGGPPVGGEGGGVDEPAGASVLGAK